MNGREIESALTDSQEGGASSIEQVQSIGNNSFSLGALLPSKVKIKSSVRNRRTYMLEKTISKLIIFEVIVEGGNSGSFERTLDNRERERHVIFITAGLDGKEWVGCYNVLE